ncbi:MAG: SDR family oxidoreductase [Hyphomicrobiales bacterium]
MINSETDSLVSPVAIVTGASRGIGLDIATHLASLGWSLLLHSSTQTRDVLEDLCTSLVVSNDDQKHHFMNSDLYEGASSIAETAFRHFGRIDALVNNAGILADKGFEDVDIDEVENVFRINTFAPYLLSRDCFRLMQDSGGGSIVNISSFTVKYAMGRNTTIHYAASKAALEIMSEGFARAGAKFNIRSNCIRPGIILTDQQSMRSDLASRVNMIPLGRMTTTKEIAAMVGFLLGPESAATTGQTITISGGE